MSEQTDIRFIFTTQGASVRLFWRLFKALSTQCPIGVCGFFTAHRYFYDEFVNSEPGFLSSGNDILTEWELLEQVNTLNKHDHEVIADWENRIGDASLWDALIVDRRLNFKVNAQYKQNYKPSYSHEELLQLLQVSLAAINDHFARVKPHAVIGLNAVTVYDYLYYLMARERGIPYFQLKLTRIRNYVSLFTEPFGISPHIAEIYRRLHSVNNGFSADDNKLLAEAKAFLAESRGESLAYEGAINKTPSKQYEGIGGKILARLSDNTVKSRAQKDPHYLSPLVSSWYNRVVRPLRRRRMTSFWDGLDYEKALSEYKGRYAVYPLNTEPEVALLGYGRPYRNQIETVRNLAAALPVGWKLAVKEHPNANGYRTKGYYEKLCRIPNVVLVSPSADTSKLIENSGLVCVVFGTIGLEAIIKAKPLVTLCHTPYGVFPSSMVRYIENPWRMAADIRDLLANHAHDETAIEAYVAAHMATSIRVNLFTELLGKAGRKRVGMDKSVAEQYEELAAYTLERLRQEQFRTDRSE